MMQEEWSLNLCLKDRDFPIGANKSDTITTYMKNSKHFIFILTAQFISRKWGEFEIDIAKYEMFHHRQHKKNHYRIRRWHTSKISSESISVDMERHMSSGMAGRRRRHY